jgi:serine/threonine protein kinase
MSGFEGLLTGHTLAERYRIERVIGRGGFAAVYEAADERLGRRVAVKVITMATPGAEARERLRARFQREARAAASLQHPNVVTVYDFGTDPALEMDFLVMELLRGEDLSARLKRSAPPPFPVALRILCDASEGVAAGHRNGLLHRDVKPGNVFLAEQERSDDFRVCVLDFGIAKITAEEETLTHLTQAGEGFLSPAYASPEQLCGERQLTPASDVFSLGVIGWELFAGERPFGRDRFANRGAETAPPLRTRAPALPEEVERVIARALALEPRKRFPDAGAFAAALREVGLADAPSEFPLPPIVVAPPEPPSSDEAPPRGAPVVGEGPTVRFRRDVEPDPAAPLPRQSRRPSPRRRRGVPRIVVAGAALLILGGAAYAALRGGGDAPETPPRGSPPAVAVAEPPASAETPPTGPVDTPPPPVLAESSSPAAEVPEPPRNRTPTAGDRAAFERERVASPDRNLPPVVVGTTGKAADANREGERLFARGNFAAAEPWFRRAVEATPENAYYRNNLGWALFRMGELGAASRELERTIRQDPAREIAHANLGEVRLAQGDTAAAIAAYRRFLELNNDSRRDRIARDKLRRIGGLPAP